MWNKLNDDMKLQLLNITMWWKKYDNIIYLPKPKYTYLSPLGWKRIQLLIVMGNMDPFVLYQPHFLRIHLKSCVHHDLLVVTSFLHQPEVLSFIMQCIVSCWYAVCKTNKKSSQYGNFGHSIFFKNSLRKRKKVLSSWKVKKIR